MKKQKQPFGSAILIQTQDEKALGEIGRRLTDGETSWIIGIDTIFLSNTNTGKFAMFSVGNNTFNVIKRLPRVKEGKPPIMTRVEPLSVLSRMNGGELPPGFEWIEEK